MDAISYIMDVQPTVEHPNSVYTKLNVTKLSDNAFATIEHQINRDWVTINLSYIDRNDLGVGYNYSNWHSEVLSGSVIIKVYDIAD